MPHLAKKSNNKTYLLPHKPTFWLHFTMRGSGVEWQDFNLPIPNYLTHHSGYYDIAWQIDGYFGTKAGIEYLNDIIGRVLVTFAENKPERLLWKPDLKSADHYYPKIRKLSALLNLHSKPSRSKAPARADSFADYAFWAIKLYVEDRIREQGEGIMIAYELIEDWAMSQFEHKERSTIRAKCRSVWAWYDNKNWELPKGRKWKMSRTEHIKKVHLNRRAKTQNKIKAILDDMFLQETIKKKNGKYKISAIAELADIDTRTVSKHLKEMGLIYNG
jgi:hypothetical protein